MESTAQIALRDSEIINELRDSEIINELLSRVIGALDSPNSP